MTYQEVDLKLRSGETVTIRVSARLSDAQLTLIVQPLVARIDLWRNLYWEKAKAFDDFVRDRQFNPVTENGSGRVIAGTEEELIGAYNRLTHDYNDLLVDFNRVAGFAACMAAAQPLIMPPVTHSLSPPPNLQSYSQPTSYQPPAYNPPLQYTSNYNSTLKMTFTTCN